VTGGKSVLVLGATGVVGHIAVQAAKLLGAGKVVGAGRNRDALEEVSRLGADATVVLGQGDDAAAPKSEADGGYDVVIDTVYGKPFLAALEATAVGGTLVTIGLGAGDSADVSFRALMGRTHVGHFNDAMPIDVVRAAYDELMRHAAQGHFQVETRTYGLDEAAEAWRAQESGPHAKLAIVP
jgi:NADPH2:quinone reductase